MVSKLTGTDWLVHDTAKAVSYNGRVFGTLHFFQLLDLDKVLRGQGRKLLLDLKFEDWYDEEAHWPEITMAKDYGSRIAKIASLIDKYKEWPVVPGRVVAD